MPGVQIVHMTTPDGPRSSADVHEILSAEDAAKPLGWRWPTASAQIQGDVLSLDSDVICNADVSHVFDQHRYFNAAVTTDIKPGAEDIRYNSGVVFTRGPKFWLELRKRLEHADFGNGENWYGIEKPFNELVESGLCEMKVLPGDQYNYVPDHADDRKGLLTHYRGNRKAWMPRPLSFKTESLNTGRDVMVRQLKDNLKRGLPQFKEECPEHKGVAVIVGGGPSLKNTILPPGDIFALNGVHDWLIDRNTVPKYHVLLDARPDNASFVQNPSHEVDYLIAGICHPDVFDALKEEHVILWVPDMDEIQDMDCLRVGGGATVGMKTMYLAYLMGYRRFHFAGVDSCYHDGHGHAYDQSLNDGEEVIDVIAAGRRFKCAPWMAKQADEFQKQARKLIDLGCDMTVHGHGLIPWMVQSQQIGEKYARA